MKYIIGIKEVHIAHITVYADSIDSALETAGNTIENEEVTAEYSYTLDRDTWTIDEI